MIGAPRSGVGHSPDPSAAEQRTPHAVWPCEENRHLRQRPAPRSGPETSDQTTSQLRLGREEAVKRVVEVLSCSGGGQGPGRGRGGRTMTWGKRERRKIGGTRESGGTGTRHWHLSRNNADGEKLEKMLGEEKMNLLNKAFEEMSLRALPASEQGRQGSFDTRKKKGAF